MKDLMKRALLVTARPARWRSGPAVSLLAANVGDVVTDRANASREGVAYANALTEARNQCPNRNNVSLVSRDTWPESNGTWAAETRIRCN